MSFRLFIYCCALCGAWAALAGWILGRMTRFDNPIAEASIKGLCLGLWVSLALSAVDALWVLGVRQPTEAAGRVLAAVGVGSIGGMFGGLVGQALFGWQPLPVFLILGWGITGLLIGASIGIYEVVERFLRGQDLGGVLRKFGKALLGGTVGGFLGGVLYLLLRSGFASLFHDKPLDYLWVPSAAGFVALGMCIGLMVGLAQVILKEAWIKVESGWRAGRELILSKAETSIGRGESSDIPLFGDAAVEKTHALIIRANHRFLLADAGTPGGTFLNGQRITQATPLQSGDLIQVGHGQIRFAERAQHSA
jgi:hypothetical protein